MLNLLLSILLSTPCLSLPQGGYQAPLPPSGGLGSGFGNSFANRDSSESDGVAGFGLPFIGGEARGGINSVGPGHDDGQGFSGGHGGVSGFSEGLGGGRGVATSGFNDGLKGVSSGGFAGDVQGFNGGQGGPSGAFGAGGYSGPIIPILSDNREGPLDGNYRFEFETGNGISRQEVGAPSGPYGAVAQQGAWRFTFPDGTPAEFSFVADENGFRVESPLLPTPPPLPPHAIAQIEKAAKEKALGHQEGVPQGGSGNGLQVSQQGHQDSFQGQGFNTGLQQEFQGQPQSPNKQYGY